MSMSDAVVFFARFTTIVGNETVVSDPYDVTSYDSVQVQVFLLSVIGGPTVQASLEMSSDMITWTAVVAPATVTAGGPPLTMAAGSTARYIRVVVAISAGTNPVSTFWAKGVVRGT
jgi:hypothetical protein